MNNTQRRSRILVVLVMAAMFTSFASSKAHADTLSDLFSFLFGKKDSNSRSYGSSSPQSNPQNNSPQQPTYDLPDDEGDLTGDEGGGPVVPEPASMALLGTGLVGMAIAYRKRKKENS